ncbi:MAG: hypothetical protein JXP48_03705 [Acidobacteria bacterium]|nr:hypothetical protein [Acidobacteriota bacterium]
MAPKSLVTLMLLAGTVLAGAARAEDSGERRITVLNPAVTEKRAPRVPLAPRAGTLEGKTVYLVDMNYEGLGRTPVLEEMERWFGANMPGVRTVRRLKSGSYVSDDPALWKEIEASRAGGVILGVAG